MAAWRDPKGYRLPAKPETLRRNEVEEQTKFRGGCAISREEFNSLRKHDYAGYEPNGTAWVMYLDEEHGTCLAKGVHIRPAASPLTSL